MEIPEKIKSLIQVIEDGSLARLIKYTDIENLYCTELIPKPNQLVYGERMCLILVSSQPVQLVFKMHFDDYALPILAAKLWSFPVDEIQKHHITEFVKEYCNLMAGFIKQTLIRAKIVDFGISLPLLLDGYDQIYFEKPGNVEVFQKHWQLVFGNVALKCELGIDVFDPSVLDQMNFSGDATDSSQEGKLEFL